MVFQGLVNVSLKSGEDVCLMLTVSCLGEILWGDVGQCVDDLLFFSFEYKEYSVSLSFV